MERLNRSTNYSGILRFIEVDISTGTSKILIGNKVYTKGPEVHTISHMDVNTLIYLLKYRKGHVKRLTRNTFIVDRWIIGNITKGERL